MRIFAEHNDTTTMKRRYPLAFLLICGALAATAVAPTGCSTAERPNARTMFVTIAPLRTLVETIVGDDFRVEVLVPDGASPETFEPTPRQFIALNEARKVFSVGLLDFETALTARLADTSALVHLARGIETIAGSCSHAHPTHRHAHGVDPHVWTSPRELGIMASNAYEAIRRTFPDSAKYERNYLDSKDALRSSTPRPPTGSPGADCAASLSTTRPSPTTPAPTAWNSSPSNRKARSRRPDGSRSSFAAPAPKACAAYSISASIP